MTVSEEELRVGTTEREAGRVRLKKYVVEEEVTKTVPVRREEVRLEREPITDANRDDATAGPEISEEEHEVVLHEEEAVVDKRAVPKERVRLEKDVTTERGDGLRHGPPGARRRRRLPPLATPCSDPGCGRGHQGRPEKPTALTRGIQRSMRVSAACWCADGRRHAIFGRSWAQRVLGPRSDRSRVICPRVDEPDGRASDFGRRCP